MSDTDEDKAQLKRVQLLTCPCCSLTWGSEELLRTHLRLVLKGIERKLARLRGDS